MSDLIRSARTLPYYENAIIDPAKLSGYVLNPDHPGEGKHKARVFRSMLGYGPEHWEMLRDRIREGLARHRAHKKRVTERGEIWRVYIEVSALHGKSAIVTTGWMFSHSNPQVPMMTTCYIETRRQDQLKESLAFERIEPLKTDEQEPPTIS